MKIKSDKVANVKADLLGRDALAAEISKSLINYAKSQKDGLTLSVTGEWGSGKSTLLFFLKQHIEAQSTVEIKIIEFNPWLFYKNESIKDAFLGQLALSLTDFETRTVKVAARLKNLIKGFRWLKYISNTVGNIQQGAEELADHFSDAYNISEMKEEIESILRKSKRKIIVFIDDIDRLMPDQIAEVFQTISLVTNFSNIIYIIAFDRQIVIDAINKNFSGKGQDYLEKTIQIDYELPPMQNERVESLFISYMDELRKEFKIDFDEYALKSLWELHGLSDYLKTIRDFKRFFNALSFRLPGIADDINPVDFLAIEAVRIFDYNSYSRFYSSYRTNQRRRELPSVGLTEVQYEALNSPATEILKALAPRSILEQFRIDRNSKRLMDPAYFDRYFTLLRNSNDISEKELREIITLKNTRFNTLNQALAFNRIENMIIRLSEPSIHKHYKTYDFTLIDALISFFNRNPDIFEAYSNRISDMLINLIAGHKNKRVFVQTFFQSFGEKGNHPSFIHFYFFHFIRRFKKDGRTFRNDYQIFEEYYKKNFTYIESQYLVIFKSAAGFIQNSKFNTQCPFLKYLYLINYAELFNQDYNSLLQRVLVDRDWAIYMASKFFWMDEDDFKIVRYEWTFRDTLFPGESFLKFYELIKDIEPELLNDWQKAVRNHLVALNISRYPEITYPQN